MTHRQQKKFYSTIKRTSRTFSKEFREDAGLEQKVFRSLSMDEDKASMDYADHSADNLSDAEADSDHEEMDDAQKLLGAWLGELENLKSVIKREDAAVTLPRIIPLVTTSDVKQGMLQQRMLRELSMFFEKEDSLMLGNTSSSIFLYSMITEILLIRSMS
ncbi:hypothetical protein JTE90_008221 [Oedothorax gibbosus]|uniref:Uncharacterized protein n=1 Tax=Oedothorax gibbosus TaxID=931172 RepID=A0AAV6TYJ2_9ARAC|nr:hypothetical protein JTE90_008221 [Oedothorax gibbosus]